MLLLSVWKDASVLSYNTWYLQRIILCQGTLRDFKQPSRSHWIRVKRLIEECTAELNSANTLDLVRSGGGSMARLVMVLIKFESRPKA